jgi:hypothetical protein
MFYILPFTTATSIIIISLIGALLGVYFVKCTENNDVDAGDSQIPEEVTWYV